MDRYPYLTYRLTFSTASTIRSIGPVVGAGPSTGWFATPFAYCWTSSYCKTAAASSSSDSKFDTYLASTAVVAALLPSRSTWTDLKMAEALVNSSVGRRESPSAALGLGWSHVTSLKTSRHLFAAGWRNNCLTPLWCPRPLAQRLDYSAICGLALHHLAQFQAKLQSVPRLQVKQVLIKFALDFSKTFFPWSLWKFEFVSLTEWTKGHYFP